MKKVCLLGLFLGGMVFGLSIATAQEANQERGNRPPREPNVLMPREKTEAFELLFDGKEVDKDIWHGAEKYKVVDGAMVCDPGGNIVTKKEYKNFVFRFEFKLPPGGNNGVGIHTKTEVDAAYNGFEVQILDDSAEQWKNLQPWQYHGSVYRFIPAKKGSLRPVGEWNSEEIIVLGNKIKVICNRQVIVDADLTEFIDGTKKPLDGKEHKFSEIGSIGFLGHGDPVAFRSIRVKEFKDDEEAKRYWDAPQTRFRRNSPTQNPSAQDSPAQN